MARIPLLHRDVKMPAPPPVPEAEDVEAMAREISSIPELDAADLPEPGNGGGLLDDEDLPSFGAARPRTSSEASFDPDLESAASFPVPKMPSIPPIPIPPVARFSETAAEPEAADSPAEEPTPAFDAAPESTDPEADAPAEAPAETASGDGSWLESNDYSLVDTSSFQAERDEEVRRHEEEIRRHEEELRRHEDAVRRHEEALSDIDRRVRETKTFEEQSFRNLLVAEGAALKEAVLLTLSYLGWGKVVDVDQYWKKVIRSKEEDLWLLEAGAGNVEVAMRKDRLVLILVRSGETGAADADCALLQTYKARRMQEFDNTKMKAVLIGNYHRAVDPRRRGSSFSELQSEEAKKDGNGLLTTFELFRAVKAEKDGLAQKQDLRRRLEEQTGTIELV